MRQCEVYLHGIKAGVLIENDKREFMFTYDKAYLLSEKPHRYHLVTTI